MAYYYNVNHVPKQFKVGDQIKLSTKNLQFKNRKLAPRQVGLFRVIECIGSQAYRITLPAKYIRLHDVFPIQLLKDYRRHEDDDSLIAVPDLEDPPDEWEIEEVRDKWKVKDDI